MKIKLFKLLPILIACCANIIAVSGQNIVKIAAAANLRYALSEIEREYEAKFKNIDLKINYGASGTFYQQITNGAPYDLFLSADDTLPRRLKEAGVTEAEDEVYACGKLALYSLKSELSSVGLEVLKRKELGRIAIANPRTAPYGARSVEILKSLGLWDALQQSIVYGESIAQAAQFAMTGNCEVGFVALSLLLNPEVELKGSYYIIPEELYAPIEQAGVVLKQGEASRFFDYMLGGECRAIWNKYGYSTDKK